MANQIFTGTSGTIYTIDKKLAQGGQGTVLKVEDNHKKAYAVKWYHAYMSNNQQKQQLVALAKQGKPDCSVSDIDFIWPIEMVSMTSNNSYGYVMPLYDSKRYVHYNRIINGKLKQPSLDKLAKLSYLICMGLSSIHKAGLAYCDINLGNIQFDVEQGKIIICDNDNVVVNNTDAQVMGVPEFMAPEVALGESQPNAQSDLYSIAILLYQLWMWEHPMDGALTEKVRCWDQPAKIKHYAKEPLFVHHPTDRRNGGDQSHILALSLKRWHQTCPEKLKNLFIRAFVDGVHEPSKRPRLNEWQQVFMEIEANTVACLNCGAANLVDPLQTEQTCFHCQTPLPVRMLLSINQRKSYLAVRLGAQLRQHHIDTQTKGSEALTVIGKVEAHPKQAGAYIFRNCTSEPWFYEHDGQSFRIEPTQARPLALDGKIKIGTTEIEILSI